MRIFEVWLRGGQHLERPHLAAHARGHEAREQRVGVHGAAAGQQPREDAGGISALRLQRPLWIAALRSSVTVSPVPRSTNCNCTRTTPRASLDTVPSARRNPAAVMTGRTAVRPAARLAARRRTTCGRVSESPG